MFIGSFFLYGNAPKFNKFFFLFANFIINNPKFLIDIGFPLPISKISLPFFLVKEYSIILLIALTTSSINIGRIYLIKDMLENNKPANEKIVKHLDRCLSCYSCMTTCPSGVNYMHMIDHGRSHIEKTYTRPIFQRLFRSLLSFVTKVICCCQKLRSSNFATIRNSQIVNQLIVSHRNKSGHWSFVLMK